MKKIFILSSLIAVLALTPICTFAEETEADKGAVAETVTEGSAEENSKLEEKSQLEIDGESSASEAENAKEAIVADKTKSDKVYVNIAMIPRVQVVDSTAVFELYDERGTLLGKKEEWIGGITTELNLEFDVPEYSAGKIFELKLSGGLTYLKYSDKVYGIGDNIVLESNVSKGDNGADVITDSFFIEGCPLYEQAIVVYAEGNQLELYPRARLIDDITMVPVRLVAETLGIDVRFDEVYNSVVCEVDGEQVIFNMDTAYATIFGEDTYLPRKSEMIDDTAFVPVRTLAEAFGSTIETFDFGDHIDVCIGESEKVAQYRKTIPVWNLSSSTEYLVWVDKSDFRVRVYTGSRYKWKEIKSFPCAIGAPGMETPTGSYEYEYRMDGWYYDGYYVGPCLVFWGNYALHSTLLGYNGVPYDNRTGVKISHGCVRLEKQDIDWLSDYLPRKSRVYITE